MQNITSNLNAISEEIESLAYSDVTYDEFNELNAAFQRLSQAIKNVSYKPGDRSNLDDFENMWTAQSILFMVDILPEFHRVLLKYYNRADELELIDVGAGNGSGANFLSQLHTGRMIYSKCNVKAIDHVDNRLRWARSQYPKVDYEVANLYKLESKKWDIVICSHCLEHVKEPERFTADLMRICRGFLFVYTPYNELDRIPGHLNTITEDFYEGMPVENIKIFNSMGWHPDYPEDKVILAVLDCRSSA